MKILFRSNASLHGDGFRVNNSYLSLYSQVDDCTIVKNNIYTILFWLFSDAVVGGMRWQFHLGFWFYRFSWLSSKIWK